MLTKINDNVYVDISMVVFYNWLEQERRCVFKMEGFPNHDFVLEGQNALDFRSAISNGHIARVNTFTALGAFDSLIERDDVAPKKKRGRPKKIVKGKRK